MEQNTQSTPQRDPLAELEKFRAELNETTGRIKSLVEKNAALEKELETHRERSTAGAPRYPTTEEGWFYALQQAELRVAANPDLAPQLEQLKYVFQQWRSQSSARQAEQMRDTGRLEAALAQMGIDQDSPHYKTALRALAGGASFAEVESTYLKSLRDLNLKGAEETAKKAQKKSAALGSIEPGEGGSRPEQDGASAGPTPQQQFMASLGAAMKGRAPASQRLAAKAE